ncbi:zinc ABC transporter substrate-binding protein [Sedimentitalea sp. JM2-8]|uniref:High-affinity zinc uptake system protein ZnuA n=1 Tax=Sedimentitalea xiamensis TaxID=3050037 RepID=A0ABT7FGY5_9RHOB|nr:zinc ABC transporter substrate-binding protein [Sedimentitalea xiamensis]MDK3074394.1 zinc ABC transporter substrate-binding protein [Sedimentitalea xiamensis]
MLKRLSLCLIVLSGPAVADVPRVAVDIAPVHSLVASVMEGVGVPELVLDAQASPHSYALRPSQARALQLSDLVIWMGPELTPWLAKPLAALAEGTPTMRLLAVEGGTILATRNVIGDIGDDHEHEHDHDHDHNHDHDHDHDNHGHIDPHAWLDPVNAQVWIGVIADALAGMDSENAAIYRSNADKAQAALADLTGELSGTLAPVRDRPYVAFHDAYQYFENRFGLTFAGTVSLSDAADASPAQVARFRDVLVDRNVRCAFREPQFDDRLLVSAAEGAELQVAVLDPLGSTLDPGPELYARLLRDMAQSLASCR